MTIKVTRGGYYHSYSFNVKSSSRQPSGLTSVGLRFVQDIEPIDYEKRYIAVNSLLSNVLTFLTTLEEIAYKYVAKMDDGDVIGYEDFEYIAEQLDDIINAAHSNLHEIDTHN